MDSLRPRDRDPGLNAERVRRDNLGRVLRELHVATSLSRSELVGRTLLDRSTIGALVEDLVRRGFVTEGAGRGGGTPGRPSSLVRLRDDGVRVLAIEIATESIAAALIGLGGHVHRQIRLRRTGERRSPDETLDDLEPIVRELLATAGGRSTIAVGVAVAGVVTHPDGLVGVAPGLGWRAVPLAELVADRLDLDLPVFVGNEADVGARAEHLRGAGIGVDDLLYVSGELGGGAIVHGRVLAGEGGPAFEIGHVPVNPDGLACRCGSVGCWETEVSASALLRHAGTVAGDPHTAEAVEALISRAAGGEASALRAMEAEGRWIGIGLAGLANILSPRRVILGGFLARIYPFVIERVRGEIELRVLETARWRLEIVPSSLGEDASLSGAAELALEPVLQDPTIVTFAEITPGT